MCLRVAILCIQTYTTISQALETMIVHTPTIAKEYVIMIAVYNI
jgi:hypothetical protein